MKFMVTFVPIFLAFMVGMYNLYWYYDPSVRNIVEVVDHKITTKAQEGFGTCVNIYLWFSPYDYISLTLPSILTDDLLPLRPWFFWSRHLLIAYICRKLKNSFHSRKCALLGVARGCQLNIWEIFTILFENIVFAQIVFHLYFGSKVHYWRNVNETKLGYHMALTIKKILQSLRVLQFSNNSIAVYPIKLKLRHIYPTAN